MCLLNHWNQGDTTKIKVTIETTLTWMAYIIYVMKTRLVG